MMITKIVKKKDMKYLTFEITDEPIQSLQGFMDLIAACMEHETDRVLLSSDILPEEFFRLRTGLAGDMIQKFVNYGIKTAIVLDDGQRIQGKFTDLMLEMNRGKDLRLLNNFEEAEKWLLQD